MRSVQDQARAQAEGVAGTGSCGWQGPVPQAMGPDIFVCALWRTVEGRYWALGPSALRNIDPTVETVSNAIYKVILGAQIC